jgi:hypothetical protein
MSERALHHMQVMEEKQSKRRNHNRFGITMDLDMIREKRNLKAPHIDS